VLIREFVAKNLPFGIKLPIMNKILLAVLLIAHSAFATDPYQRNPSIDIKQYTFQLEVNDSTDVISGKASIQILFKKSVTDFELDLTSKNAIGQGMEVVHISVNGKPLAFEHKNDRLKIFLA
jgi:aminopeptidase N